MGMRLGLLAFVFFVFGCGTNSSRPKNVLPEDKMVEVLADIYTNEEKVNMLGLNPDSAHQVFEIMMAGISKSDGVSDTAIKQSIYYYMEHPKELDNIYTVLIDTLQLREQRAAYK
jgi:hypothetical protein